MKKMLFASTAIFSIPSAFMNDFCPVVKVIMNGQEVRINKSDYDENPGNFQLADGDDGSGTDPRIETFAPAANATLGDKIGAEGAETIGKLMANDGEPAVYTDEQLAIFAAFQPGVDTKKKISYIVDTARGNKLVDDIPGIDPKGYDKPDDAWRIAFEVKQKLARPAPNAGDGGNPQS